ncbi:MAG: CapA family protein [Candidatus Magasanikbacteria bacterium]|jgi:gamma-polyglutamate biosynthesis protein CapA|nr:CapA family protein [Candidatus Magasanikbacteria bacterium]MBT4315323.1 CapA family protein [Candidatus Magasanikbacteria bacterium]MBT4547195.1 CapA family protein [Candidatus Magasanikbacteria bacterium]MBT6818859.1 CapA family protein [Candidatus Magasanikbacteria bacterium]
MKWFKIIIIVFITALIGLSAFFYFSLKKDLVIGEDLPILQKMNLSDIITPPKQKEIILPKDQLSLLFTGDIMLDRSVYLKTLEAGDYNHSFQNLDYFFDYDLRIGNLEGAITNFKSISNGTGGSRFFFTFSPEFLEPLAKYFDVFSLANNHTLNFGYNGLKQTRDYLGEQGISYFGDPENDPENLSFIIEKNNIRVGMIGYHDLVVGGFDDTILEIERIRPLVDYLVVIPHWGTEYITDKVNNSVKTKAHTIIDSGADVIIGTHPHVIQPIEEYNGKMIFYSLGNFIFDQYFSTDTQQGLNVAIFLEKGDNIEVEYNILPIVINNDSQPALSEDIVKEEILDKIVKF